MKRVADRETKDHYHHADVNEKIRLASVALHRKGLWLKFGAILGVVRTSRAAGERGATQYLLVRTSAA
jgi:hypothetical protein